MVNRKQTKLANLKESIETVERHINISLNILRNGEASNLLDLSVDCLSAFFHYCYDEETGCKNRKLFRWNKRKYLEVALKADITAFKLKMNALDPPEVELDGHVYKFTDTRTRSLDSSYWRTCWDVALILKDKDSIDFLCQIPQSVYTKEKTDDYSYFEIDFLKSLYTAPKTSQQLFLKAYQATDPKALKFDPLSAVLNITVPVLNMYIPIMKGDSKEFNKFLEEQLNILKEFIVTGDIKHQYNQFALAVCSFAYDNGINITVESPYIPKDIYEGRF